MPLWRLWAGGTLRNDPLLPQSWRCSPIPLVIAVACIVYAIEFFADKIPYVDNGWDVLHTFIRVPAGAILAARSLGDMSPGLEFAALLAGGSIALGAHGTEAASRLAINASPEPFSNWIASFVEDVAVLGGIWIIFKHPWLMLALVFVFLALMLWIVPKIFRLAKRGFTMLFNGLRGIERPQAKYEYPLRPL